MDEIGDLCAELVSNPLSRNKTLRISIQFYVKADKKTFQPSPVLLHFFIKAQIFCSGLLLII